MRRISRITVIGYRYSLPDFEGSIMRFRKGASLEVERFLVTIEDSDGAVGEYAPHYGATPQALAQVLLMAPMLVGRDPDDRTRIYEDLKVAFRHFDRVGIAALDAALWDLAGKRAGTSVARLLGGCRERLPIYASTCVGEKGVGALGSAEAYADFAEDCAGRGITAFKIHAFRDGRPETEIAVITAVARRVGERMKLMTDPASSLRSYADALRVGHACDDLGYYWYEDPYADASTSAFAHARMRAELRTPLLITEHVRGVEAKADFMLQGGTDMLHIDPELDGGVTGTMRLAAFASALGMDVQLHTAAPLHRQCMAAIPNTHFYELALVAPDRGNSFFPPIYADGYSDELADVGSDGCVPVPDGPGFGVVYDREKLARFATARHEFA